MSGSAGIKYWPRGDRPREKLLDHGPAVLSVAELLALILRSGTAGESAVVQARAVLAAASGSLARSPR